MLNSAKHGRLSPFGRVKKSLETVRLRLETLACDRNKLQQVEPGALSGPLVASLQAGDDVRHP